ncbi:MAG: cytochrome P450 family protein [Segniliparus sp.]|uniref:cytochrome P450 family protein n=1 Tax=Segniliparus sp. TaxID=2804064 RepID=UPI003F37EF41
MPYKTIAVTPDFVADPWPTYESLRADGPVHKIRTPAGITAWLIIDYAAARHALSDPAFSKDLAERIELIDDQLGRPHSPEPIRPALLGLDPPDHTRLRKLATKAFTAQASAKLRPRVEEIVAGLIDGLRAEAGAVDLVPRYAYPLPIAMISELLGVPEKDRDRFSSWSRQIMDHQSPDQSDAVAAASTDFRDFVGELVAAKRAEPGPGDLLDELIAARDDSDKLSDEELFSLIIILLIAGHETTVNLISTATAIVAADPALRARVIADPDVASAVVEETLRFDGPASVATLRHTKTATVLGDVEIPAGELVFVGLSAANRDPAKFPDPDRFDPDRATAGHLAFGHGIHFCVGAALARIEGEVAVRELFRAFPELSVAEEKPQWRPSFIRGRLSLPVRLSPAR